MRTLPAEITRFADRTTGVEVTQLTDHFAHSWHIYFTHTGWWDGGRRLLFGSDRFNRRNLYSVELASGEITQITDDDEPGDFQMTALSPTREEAYYQRGGAFIAVDLRTAEQRVVYEYPETWTPTNMSVTADGRHLCTAFRDPVDIGPLDLRHGYVGFRELFEAHPHERIVRIPVDGGEPEVLFEEDNWITHVNTSPVHPHLLTFCHEGPWHLVEQRIWGLNMQTGEVWKVRPQEPGTSLGHEYWLEDGQTLGYHGHTDGEPFFGFSKYDNSECIEAPFPDDSHHFQSNTRDLIVGDGAERNRTPYILLWRFDGSRFDGPRVLCTHRASRHIQVLHVHPRFSPDGSQVLYTADPRGYGNVHLVDVPDFESLPQLSDV